MSKQLNMDELFGSTQDFSGDRMPTSFGEPHMACALLLDVSGSMNGQPIASLNEAIRRFKDNVMKDPIARQRVDISLIIFHSEVEVISDFVPISEMPTPVLQAGGRTEMAGGIQVAIDLVKKRTQMYSALGTPCHKPWIFMITDGLATSSYNDMEEAAQRIHLEENKGSHGHLSFWALGIDNYDKEQLFSLTNRVMELRDQNFEGIFDWLSESMSAISQSQVGERVAFNDLPENARKAQMDRAITDDWY